MNIYKLKLSLLNLVAISFFASIISSATFAQSLDTVLEYYNGSLQVHVMGPQSITKGRSANNTFTIQINDSTGNPYPPITKQWVQATVEMTSMDMGIDPVEKVEDVLDSNNQPQGLVKLSPIFSMAGPWKMNISITVADDNGKAMTETQAVNFEVSK